MTDEEVIRRGNEAKALLNNEVFRSVIEDLGDVCTNIVFASKPDEQAKRETFYHQHVALQTIVGILETRVNAMQILVDKQEPDTDEDDEYGDY